MIKVTQKRGVYLRIEFAVEETSEVMAAVWNNSRGSIMARGETVKASVAANVGSYEAIHTVEDAKAILATLGEELQT